MKKDLEKLNKINAELSRLLKIFRGTFNCDVLLGVWLSFRKELRAAFDAGFCIDVQLLRGSRLAGESLRAYSYGELEYLDIRVEEIDNIFCQRVVSCK